jgi:hypothetical protein
MFECSEMVIDIALNEQHKNLFRYTHWYLMNVADIAELQKWAWSICLEGLRNNKTPYWTASDIYSEVPGSNLCRGSDCSQVLCGIRNLLLTNPGLDLDSGHSCFPQHAFHFIIEYGRSLDAV